MWSAYEIALLIYGGALVFILIALWFSLRPPDNAVEEAWRGFIDEEERHD